MSNPTDGIADLQRLAEIGKLVLQATQAWGGNEESLNNVVDNRRALNRIGHRVVLEEHGIFEIMYPFHLCPNLLDDSTLAELRRENVVLDNNIFKEGNGRWFSYNSGWDHVARSIVSGPFTLLLFKNNKGLNLHEQIKLLESLGYCPAQLRMAPAFVKRVSGGLASEAITGFGVRKYVLLGSVAQTGENNMVPVLIRRNSYDGKSGPWHLRLEKINSESRDFKLLATPVSMHDLKMKLPGPGHGLGYTLYDEFDDRPPQQQGLK